MPAGRYLFIPFLRTKSQMHKTKNWSSEKSHKKDHRTNIIATNFVCEQLNIVWKQRLKSYRLKKLSYQGVYFHENSYKLQTSEYNENNQRTNVGRIALEPTAVDLILL